MKCPNCGAEIGVNSKFCESCGSQISYEMKREQELLNRKGCPKCGSSNVVFTREEQGYVKGSNGTKVIRHTVGVCKDCGNTWYTDTFNDNGKNNAEAPAERSKTWLWVLGWIFFFPAPVMVLIWRKKNTWDIKIKLAVTAVFWILIFALGHSNDNKTTDEITATSSTAEISSTEEQPNPSKLDIITIKDHPLYFGSVNDAKEVWKDYLGKEILIDPKSFEFNDDSLIAIEDYGSDSTLIKDLQIYLGHASENVDLNSALAIANEYLPLEQLRKYYTFEDSYILKDDDGDDIHIVYYKITDEGYNLREETKADYGYTMPSQIYVWFWGNDSINLIRMTDEMDNAYWESNYQRNGFERVEWHYDFLE